MMVGLLRAEPSLRQVMQLVWVSKQASEAAAECAQS